jgi:hypothetical protein
MDVDAYLHLLRTLSPRGVAFGTGGVEVIAAEEIQQAQSGYSVGPDGRSLTGTGEGDWQPSWLVIAYETLCGDPIFIDLAQPGMPVHTAMHGMGEWWPGRIADSAASFFHALDRVRGVAVGREHPVGLAGNPLPESERRAVLREIAAMNPLSDAGFWEDLLGAGF